MINLISDTVTIPTQEMLREMMVAPVGDDVFSQDPTINKLQVALATMFKMEDALFCPSGTMTNQIAIRTHTNPMDEMICNKLSHVYQSENGGYAYNSGIAVDTIIRDDGKISPGEIEAKIKPDYDWLPNSKLVVVENTCNIAGGTIYTETELQSISDFCRKNNLLLHLDGARLFNAWVENKYDLATIGPLFDSISICLSKGLGAPVGSVLLGSKAFIKKARKIRKAMGGGMRQAGILAAAGLFALENNIERLKEDNNRAKQLGITLESCDYVSSINPVESNIVIFHLQSGINASTFLDQLKQNGILAVAFGPHTVRFVTHLDVGEEDISKTKEVLKNLTF